MAKSYHTDPRYRKVIDDAANVLGTGLFVVGQIAVALSLRAGRLEELETSQYDRAGGAELNVYYFDNDHILKLMCCGAHGIGMDDKRVDRIVEFHLNRGLAKLADMLESVLTKQGKGRDDVLWLLANFVPAITPVKGIRSGSSERVCVFAGRRLDEQVVSFLPNTEGGTHNNAHVAIAGSAGVGKSQLLLSLLVQTLEQAKRTGCVLFDYKGDLSTGKNWAALERGGFRKYVLGDEPFPINPLRIPSDEKPELAAQSFAEVCKVHSTHIGPIQTNALRNALTELYHKARKTEQVPSLGDVSTALHYRYEEEGKPVDTLVDLFEQLADFRLFADGEGLSAAEFMGRRLVLDLSKREALRTLCSFFVLHFLNCGLKELGEAPLQEAEDGTRVRGLVSVLAIDEAHHYLSLRNTPLHNLVRQGRSLGLAIWLSSQSIADYAQDKDVFVNNVGTWFMFSQGKIPTAKDLSGLLKVSDQISKRIAGKLSSLSNGHCFCNLEGSPEEIVAAQLYARDKWPKL